MSNPHSFSTVLIRRRTNDRPKGKRGYCSPAAADAASARAAPRRGDLDLGYLQRDVARADLDLSDEITQHRQHRVRDGRAARHRTACSHHAPTAATADEGGGEGAASADPDKNVTESDLFREDDEEGGGALSSPPTRALAPSP